MEMQFIGSNNNNNNSNSCAMNDINRRIESLQQEIVGIKKDIIILKGSSNLLFINNDIRRPTLRQITECVGEVVCVPLKLYKKNNKKVSTCFVFVRLTEILKVEIT